MLKDKICGKTLVLSHILACLRIEPCTKLSQIVGPIVIVGEKGLY